MAEDALSVRPCPLRHSTTARRRLRRAAAVVVFLGTFAVLEERIRESNHAEANGIGLIRAVISGESSYAAAYGYYDRLECLASPRSCVPGVTSPTQFVPPDVATSRGEIRFYRFELHAGPRATSAGGSSKSPSAMTRYAVVAVPLISSPRKYRAFCGDDRQVIYQTTDGAVPRVADGRCVDTTHVLQ
jgi:hypothetical protein